MSSQTTATDDASARSDESNLSFRPRSDRFFFFGMITLGGAYVFLVISMLLANAVFTFAGEGRVEPVLDPQFAAEHPVVATFVDNALFSALANPDIQDSLVLSLISSTITTILALWVAVPIGYLMSRFDFRGKPLIDAVLDIPIVLPPLVVGLCLLILFRFFPFSTFSRYVVFEVPGVILAQFMVAAAFAVRTMRATFDQISPRQEHVAMTLGCSHGQAFWHVGLPQARQGLLTAATLAWARSLGEFGPILILASTTRGRTEVLPTTVYMELHAGNLKAALAVSLIMILFALVILILARVFGVRQTLA